LQKDLSRLEVNNMKSKILLARLTVKRLLESLGVHASLSSLSIAILLFGLPLAVSAQSYTVSNLTADLPGVAANTDANLIGPVGLSRGIIGKWWVPNSGSATATLYDGNGVASALIVSLPSAPGTSTPTSATGTVFTGAAGFNVTPGNPALFMFVTLDGTILGWSPNVDLFNAVVLVNRHGKASYTGMTTAEIGASHYLYAVNALTANIEIFDTNLKKVSFGDAAFREPGLPDGLVPFNVQNIGKDIVVTYHRDRQNDSEGPQGWVAIFDARGHFLSRLHSSSSLVSPWGVALAPQDYGEFSHLILVANHGSGQIAAFDPFTGQFVGFMLDPNGNVISIDGLWALGFADGGIADFTTVMGPYNACYFTAGTQMGEHGLFGSLVPVDSDQTHDEE
jgi:uncharacterized protein (TIGR03118 family)